MNYLAVLLAVLVSLALTIGSHQHAQRVQSLRREALVPALNRFEPVQDFAIAAAGAGLSSTRPQPVHIGIEISNIYNVSLPQQTFMANGNVWLHWPAAVQDWMDAEGLEPQQLIQFTNNIVSYDLLVEPNIEKPKVLADGSREQSFLFSGHFWTETIDFKNFPFLRLKLPIQFEIKPEVFSLTGPRPIALIADARQPGLIGSQATIPGLVLEGGLIEPYLHRFADDASFNTNRSAIVRAQVMASAVFSTHPNTSIGQWLIPILIVMLTVFVAPSISSSLSDMRVAVPSAALLTLVVMQQSYETSIPQLSYLTFLDLIYLWCYGVTAGLFILFVWGSNQLTRTGSDQPDHGARLTAICNRIDRVDRQFQMASLLATVLFVLVALNR